jgi:hypothetical protein
VTAPAAPLRNLADAIEGGGALTAEERHAVAEALRAVVTLPATLPGQRSLETRQAQAERDRLICTMAREFFAGPLIAPTAETVAKRLAQYRGGQDWKRDQAAESIGYRGTVRGHCWAVLRAVDRPLSARRIRAILAASSGSSWPVN